MTNSDFLSYSIALQQFRRGLSDTQSLPDAQDTTIKILLAGNANLDFMIPGLSVQLKTLGINAEITSLPYDSWIQQALSGETKTDFWIIWHSSIGASHGGLERPNTDFSSIKKAVNMIRGSGQQVLFILPEPLEAELDPFSPFCAWRYELIEGIRTILPPSTVMIPGDHVHRKIGDDRWFANRYWTSAKTPAHPNGMTQLGKEVASIISQILRRDIKAIVVDLDDTLWGGTVGDIGPENLQLDPYGNGRPFLEMQRFLMDVMDTGVPLCVSTKNSAAQARRPFTERSEMLLKFDDFTYFEASWKPKHIAISKIAERLNLSLDTVCLIDDSPHERHEAQTYLPDLIVPTLAGEPENRVAALRRSGRFIAPIVDADDIRRTQRYKDEEQRHIVSKNAGNPQQYLNSLEMCLTAQSIDMKTLSRATNLVQKTNQFNLSGRRHTSSTIMKLINDPASYSYCFEVSDIVGNAGIISVVLGLPVGNRLKLDTWVLSCRVFTRTVEHAIFEHILRWAQNREIQIVEAEYTETDRNSLVKEFFLPIANETAGLGTKITFHVPTDTKIKHHLQIVAPEENW